MKNRAMRLRDNSHLFNEFSDYTASKIRELAVGNEISHLLDLANKENLSVFTTDIDKIVRVNNEFKAIFELKHSKNDKDFLLKFTHYKTLKLLSEAMNVPCYIILRNGKFWYVKELQRIDESEFERNYWRTYLKLKEMWRLNQKEMISFLKEVIEL